MSLGSLGQWEAQPALLPLTPTGQLEDHRSALGSGDAGFSLLQNPPVPMDLFAQEPSQDFCMGFGAEENPNLLMQDLVDSLERTPHPENVLLSNDVTAFQAGNAGTPDLLESPSGDFLFGEDDVEDEDGLPSPLNDLMEDAALLDEIGLLDLALEEGFSPEMAARLDEEGYLSPDVVQQEPGTDQILSQPDLSGDQVPPGDSQQGSHMRPWKSFGAVCKLFLFSLDLIPLLSSPPDSEKDADSDSGLSLDFSHGQASPCSSETSSYSSSSSSGSSDESPFSEDEDTQGLCGGGGPHLEMEVTIKQEEEEEELGAAGGSPPDHAKQPFHQRYQDEKFSASFPWQEHIGHDHTYNQPCSPPSLPEVKMSRRHGRSSVRRHSAKPYHHSSNTPDGRMWSHDDRRARALKVPFSNELIVNLPVEKFNELLATFQLDEEQLALIKDIRRRGKNKVAAQNCRRRKMDVLLDLSDEVSGLMRRRSRLLREKQEAMRNLQDMKHRLKMLHQEVFSRLRDEEGRLLNPAERELRLQADGSVTVASSGRGGATPPAKSSRKQRNKRK